MQKFLQQYLRPNPNLVLSFVSFLIGVYILQIPNKFVKVIGLSYLGFSVFAFLLASRRIHHYLMNIFGPSEVPVGSKWSLSVSAPAKSFSSIAFFATLLTFTSFARPPLNIAYGSLFAVLAVSFLTLRSKINWQPNLNLYLRILGLTSIALFCGTVLYYTVNLPFADDYLTFIKFLSEYEKVGFFQFVKSLFSTHFMEHIVAGSNLVVLLSYKISGGFNATTMTVIGFILMFVFTWLFTVNLSQANRDWQIYLPIVLMVFQLSYYQIVTWTTNIGGVFLFQSLCLASLYLIFQGGFLPVLFAAGMAMLATFTFGTGFLIFYFGLFVLTVKQRIFQALVWLIPMTISLIIYFQNFRDPSDAPLTVSQFIMFLLPFLGSMTTLGVYASAEVPVDRVGQVVSTLTGLLFFVGITWATFKKLYLKSPVIYSFLIFTFISALLATKQRGYLGIQQAFQSRYHFYSAVIAVCLFILAVERWPDKSRKLMAAFLGFTIWFNVASFVIAHPYMRRHNESMLYGFYVSELKFTPPMHVHKITATDDIYFASLYSAGDFIKEGIIHFPDRDFKRIAAEELSHVPDKSWSDVTDLASSSKVEINKVFIEVQFRPKDRDGTKNYFIGISSQNKASFFKLTKLDDLDVNWTILKYYYESPAVMHSLVLKSGLPAGEYQVWLYQHDKNLGQKQKLGELVL